MAYQTVYIYFFLFLGFKPLQREKKCRFYWGFVLATDGKPKETFETWMSRRWVFSFGYFSFGYKKEKNSK